MNDVEDDFTFVDIDFVVFQAALLAIAAVDAELRLVTYQFFSSGSAVNSSSVMYFFNSPRSNNDSSSVGIVGTGC